MLYDNSESETYLEMQLPKEKAKKSDYIVTDISLDGGTSTIFSLLR